MATIPTEDEVLGYFDKLSNWGRWGDDDQLGTPNLITPEVTKRALALVQEGATVSLSREIMWEGAADVPSPPVHFMIESGEGWASGEKVSYRPNQAAIDYIGMVFHGVAVTHVDSLAHFFWNGKTYNGKPAHLVSTSLGATVCSVVEAKQGFISRGVLVDVPLVRGVDWLERGEGVMPEDILAEVLNRLGADPTDAPAYYLLHPTIFAYLTYLESIEVLEHHVERGRSLWQRR